MRQEGGGMEELNEGWMKDRKKGISTERGETEERRGRGGREDRREDDREGEARGRWREGRASSGKEVGKERRKQ